MLIRKKTFKFIHFSKKNDNARTKIASAKITGLKREVFKLRGEYFNGDNNKCLFNEQKTTMKTSIHNDR